MSYPGIPRRAGAASLASLDSSWLLETQSVWSPNSSEVLAIDARSRFGKCEGLGLGECDSWLPYAWQALSMLGEAQRRAAWEALQTFEGTTSGSTLTSALWFVAGEVPRRLSCASES